MTGHEHVWAGTGLYNHDGSISAPCTIPGCEAELVVAGGVGRIVDGGFSTLGLDLEDEGGIAKIVCREVERDYRLPSLEAGDVVVDVGAHVGVVSIYLASEYPGLTVYALEPVPDNYARLVRNIGVNGVAGSVIPINLAVTADGRDVQLSGDLAGNSGGLSIYGEGGYPAASATLAELAATYAIDRVALLKIDCEGAEYEILAPEVRSPDVLARVGCIRGEFHRVLDQTPEDLLSAVREIVPNTFVTVCG